MKIRKTETRIVGVVFTILLLLGIGFSATSTANAQRRNWDGYPNWGGSFQLRETALNAGYNEGSKEGRNDVARNRWSNYTDFSAYRNATKDYNGRLGDRELYRRYYQKAFESGYDTERGARNTRGYDNNNRNNNYGNNANNHPRGWGRDWNRYGTYGGSYQLRQTALNAGYNEGAKQGRKDRSRGRWNEPQSFGQYQSATADYNNRLGDRELYRRYYREGFQNGYSDGYNGY